MPATTTAAQRLYNQRITKPCHTADEVVCALTAVQAQDYLAALWVLGLRTQNATEADVEQAIADRRFIRTWPMRGTLHFVPAADARWMLKLLTPRVIAQSAGRYRQLELDEAAFARSADLLTAALHGGRALTREALYQALEAGGLAASGQRGYHILAHHAQQGLLCLGPREGKQQTFVLLDEWIPAGRSLARDEALAELAERYFTGHGPATVQDFAWWAGLTLADARAGLEDVKSQLVAEKLDEEMYWMAPAVSPPPEGGSVYLLPAFDEYLLGYKERGVVLDPQHVQKVIPGKNGMFNPVIVVDGQVAGTWKRSLKKKSVELAFSPFAPLTEAQQQAILNEAQRYADFLGLPLAVM